MAINNNLFGSMVSEAMEEVGNKGWKNATSKAVTLAAFGMLADILHKRIDRLVRPAWIIALSLASAAIWLIISSAFMT